MESGQLTGIVHYGKRNFENNFRENGERDDDEIEYIPLALPKLETSVGKEPSNQLDGEKEEQGGVDRPCSPAPPEWKRERIAQLDDNEDNVDQNQN